MYVAKTKALISCAVTVQLICGFIVAYEKAGFLMTRLKMIKKCFIDIVEFRIELFGYFPRCKPLLNNCLQNEKYKIVFKRTYTET